MSRPDLGTLWPCFILTWYRMVMTFLAWERMAASRPALDRMTGPLPRLGYTGRDPSSLGQNGRVPSCIGQKGRVPSRLEQNGRVHPTWDRMAVSRPCLGQNRPAPSWPSAKNGHVLSSLCDRVLYCLAHVDPCLEPTGFDPSRPGIELPGPVLQSCRAPSWLGRTGRVPSLPGTE